VRVTYAGQKFEFGDKSMDFDENPEEKQQATYFVQLNDDDYIKGITCY
jgi:hypothetical protein